LQPGVAHIQTNGWLVRPRFEAVVLKAIKHARLASTAITTYGDDEEWCVQHRKFSKAGKGQLRATPRISQV
jgi:hypothetical protein